MDHTKVDGGSGFSLEAPDRELMHRGAMHRYWNDPVFHARAKLTFDLLGSAADHLTVIYALYVDDNVRARIQADACDEERGTEIAMRDVRVSIMTAGYSNSVRVTHLPTGIVAISDLDVDQDENRRFALERLTLLVRARS